MGSFSPDFRCPLCGRRGIGGYIVDAYMHDQAMCTEGNYSRLWFQMIERGRSAGEIYQNALQGVLRQSLNQPEVLRNIVQFLFGEEEDLFWSVEDLRNFVQSVFGEEEDLFWSAPIAADDGGQQAP